MAIKYSISAGSETYKLSDADTLRQNELLTLGALYYPRLPNKFYTEYSDTYLVDLLELHADRDELAVNELPKLYSDLGNLSDFIVDGYIALAMSDLTMDDIFIPDADGDVDEAQTAALHELLDSLQRGSFMSTLLSLATQGAIYGHMYAALVGDRNDLRIFLKEPSAVFPIFYDIDPEPFVYLVSYDTYVNGTLKTVVEQYERGAVNVYIDKVIAEAYSSANSLNEFTLVQAPFIRTAEWYGQGVLYPVMESIVDACGIIGSSNHSVRQQLSGWYVFSGESATDIERKLSAQSGKSQKEVISKTAKKRFANPDLTKVIFGKDITGSIIESALPTSMSPYIAEVFKLLAMKCPLFALNTIGADASGYARRLTMSLLETRVKLMRHGIVDVLNEIARVGSLIVGKPIKTNIEVAWPSVFPVDEDGVQNRLLALQGAGNVPKSYVNQELGIESQLVDEWIEGEADRETAKQQQNTGFFGGLFSGDGQARS